MEKLKSHNLDPDLKREFHHISHNALHLIHQLLVTGAVIHCLQLLWFPVNPPWWNQATVSRRMQQQQDALSSSVCRSRCV